MIDKKKVPVMLDDYQDTEYNVISVSEDKAGDDWGQNIAKVNSRFIAPPSHHDDRHFRCCHFRNAYNCASVSLLLLLPGHTQF